MYRRIMMNEELFTTLAARKLAGEATIEELATLEKMLQEDAVLREQFHILQQYFTESAYHSSADTEQALQRTLSRIERPVKKLFPWKWMAAAVAAVTITVAVTLIYRQPAKQNGPTTALADTTEWLHRENGKATRASIELTDGSKIWLNSQSKLTYPEVFDGESRSVYLEGEAFFDVAANPQKPFIVHLSTGMVYVLGTSFNVRAYENEPVQTSVKTGKVAFISGRKDDPDTVFITPDEKVTYRPTVQNIVKEATVAAEDIAWTEGRLVFRDRTLEDISSELERTFGKKVLFMSDVPRYYRLTGSFRDNNLQDIMYYLARSKNFHYTITDSTVLISE